MRLLCRLRKYGLFLAPKAVSLLSKSDNFLQKDGSSVDKARRTFRKISEAGISSLAPRRKWLAPRGEGSRREGGVRAAKTRFSHLEASRRLGLDVGSRLGFPTQEAGGSMNGYGGDDSRGCCAKSAGTLACICGKTVARH
ncbi:hypothetical protein OSB04_011008 [Centaurea solstitialis]|uniref:Uncharacterized protein n=1 Tax=Centaurea solstitialis TaxID=347529 RepID=A0AA38T8M7_9ASTR|nr:hypothetical protein OSB04_011008 [Centaurea solstitialis]